MMVRSGAPQSLLRRCSSFCNSASMQRNRPIQRGFKTKEEEERFLNEEIDPETQAEYDYWVKKRPIFPLSRQGLKFREDDDANSSSYLKIDMEERFAKAVHELTISIKEELEATFSVKRDEMTDEEYTNPSTKRMPLYIQPRPMDSFSITLFHGSSKVKSLPVEDIDRWYRLLVLRLEESGFAHENGGLTEENIAHPEDYYFKFDSVVTFPPKTYNLLVLQLRASLAFYRLYEDVQIVSNRIPELRPLVHRSAKNRRPIWLPQIVLADIRNHMNGCKNEEKRLRQILLHRELQPFAYFPDWIRLAGPRPREDKKKYNWDFTFEHLRNAKRPTVPPPFYPDDLRY